MLPIKKDCIILTSVVPCRIKNTIQSIVRVGKEYRDLLEREREGKENLWSAIELAQIHSQCYMAFERRDTCYGFTTKDGLLNEIAKLFYTPTTILVL